MREEWELAWQVEHVAQEEVLQWVMREHWGQMKALEQCHITLSSSRPRARNRQWWPQMLITRPWQPSWA